MGFLCQVISDGFFKSDILGHNTEDNLESLGELGGRQVLVLSVVCVSVFLVTVLGTRVLGKLGLLTVPVTFMLLVSLVIRACLAGGGTLGILTLLAPDWAHLTSPASWMVAVAQVTSDSDSVNKYYDEDYPLRSSSVSSPGWAPCLPTPVTTATITTSCGTPPS